MRLGFVFLAVLVLLGAGSVCWGAVKVVRPDGGESIGSGGTYLIEWECDMSVSRVRIEFSFTGGGVWRSVAGDAACINGKGSYSWDVPDVSSKECLVKVVNEAKSSDFDESDGVFRVFPCALAADFNGDCVVNFVDLSYFSEKWLSCGDPYDVDCVGNHAPVIVSVAVVAGQVAEDYSYTVEAKDADGDTLVFGLAERPEGMTIGEGSGLISWVPKAWQQGTNTVAVQVSDDAGAADYQVFEVEVAPGVYSFQDTGAPVDGFGSLRERRGLVYTNAVRMAPIAYRDKYMSDFDPAPGGILEAHPAVNPVYYSRDLNDSARYHAEDMASACGLQHDSCDGTAWYERIWLFYTCHGGIGENVAYGYGEARWTVNQFLCDRYGSDCAADGTVQAGHRDNIMNESWREAGHGNADPYWWVQDFGDCEPAVRPAIVAGCHDFVDSGKTSFLLNYFDEGGAGPIIVQVVVDEAAYDMSLDIGMAHRGTYRLDLGRASECRSYYFLAVTAGGEGWRYPGPGVFMTVGEGTCAEDYVEP